MKRTAQTMDRRQVLQACSALIFLGGLPGRALAQAAATGGFSDAHAHLFNLADLPARGFFEHVVLWKSPLSKAFARSYWLALLDLVQYLQRHAPTAAQEIKSHVPEISDAVFNQLVGDRIRSMARQSRRFPGSGRDIPTPPLDEYQLLVRDSYYSFATTLSFFSRFGWAPRPGMAVEDALEPADVHRIQAAAANLTRLECAEAPKETTDRRYVGQLLGTVDWCKTMIQPRRVMLDRYLDATGGAPAEGAPHRTIVNLLVDYDRWLDDSPIEPASSQDKQIEIWTKLAREASHRRVRIRTFAGYDPLRAVEESFTRTPGAETTLERLSTYLDERGNPDAPRVIHGFKIYPPMGFKPHGNDESMFLTNRQAVPTVKSRWERHKWPFERIGSALDEELQRFYRLCAEKNAPLLAHAYHSNEAGPCFGARANPIGWLRILREHPNLRLCLGHFASAKDFGRSVQHFDDPDNAHPRMWAVRDTQHLLRLNRDGHRVFADISYMSEFIMWGGRRRAARFMTQLKSYIEKYDPRCEHFLFGTDWVLLGREWRHENYVERIRGALEAADWPSEWQENLLHRNLERFLGRD